MRSANKTFVLLGCLSLLVACSEDPSSGDTSDTATSTTDTSVTETSDPDSSETDPMDSVATSDPDTVVEDTTVVNLEPTLVRIVAPNDGATVTGSIIVRLEPVEGEELKVDSVRLRVNGVGVFEDTKLPTQVVLDTRLYAPSEMVLNAEAQLGFENGTHEISVTPRNPPITFVSATAQERFVRDGQVVSLLVGIDGPPGVELAADFSAVDSEYDPAFVSSYPIGGGEYAVSYVISADNTKPDGNYIVPITASVADWVVEFRQASLNLRNRQDSPVSVTGGLFVDELLPQPTGGWDVLKPVLTKNSDFVVTGGSIPLAVDFTSYAYPNEIVGLVVGLEGRAGFYQFPLDASDGIENLDMLLRQYASFETPPQVLPLRVALRDVLGRISAYGSVLYQVAPVGSGDIQVSASWDSPTDVDLHVIDPFGCEVYYGNRMCNSGGELDLDSNAGCGIDGVNNENIFWPAGEAPVGTYTVKLAYWSDCSGHDANYSVTVSACGRLDVFEGRFLQGTDTGGGSGTGDLITTFSNAVCQNSIRGRLRYEDRTFDDTGFGARSWKPLRNAVVELRRLQGGEVLATSSSDANGNYEIQYTNDGPPGLVVAVQARTDNGDGLRDIKVLDHPKFKRLYEVTSLPIVLQNNEEIAVQDIDISVERDAGAFNIFDVLQQGHDLVRRQTGKDLGELISFWATGSDTTETLFCSDFFYDSGICTDRGSVSVQGKDVDRDEYDDMIILKEFFKFALERLSEDTNPGGTYDGTRDDANRAWSEGVSTFFANDVLKTRYFVNSRPGGIYIVDDVEDINTPWGFRTTDGTELGGVSPYLVTALLWDLADSIDAEVFDGVGLQAAIYDVVFNYLPSASYADRGAPGVDLVDFLDGWFCRGWGNRAEVEALVVDNRDFPYDFAGPTGCEHL